MKTLFLTNEFPPTIYGGVGVHLDCHSRDLARLMEVEVRCYSKELREPRIDSPSMKATGSYTMPNPLHSVFNTVQHRVDWNTQNVDADLVHLHTWYTHFGGLLAKFNYGIPMVPTVHSLEPLRSDLFVEGDRGADARVVSQAARASSCLYILGYNASESARPHPICDRGSFGRPRRANREAPPRSKRRRKRSLCLCPRQVRQARSGKRIPNAKPPRSPRLSVEKSDDRRESSRRPNAKAKRSKRPSFEYPSPTQPQLL